MSEVTLKPCPFCGSEPWSGPHGNGWAIQCINNDCTVKPAISRSTWETLVSHWNTRQSLTPARDDDVERGFVSEAANAAAAQWRWVAQSLHASIANLGYPVGMGMAPNAETTERAAKLICEYVACQVDVAIAAMGDGRQG